MSEGFAGIDQDSKIYSSYMTTEGLKIEVGLEKVLGV